MSGILYVVATPIGNLKDITLRALEIFKNVDLVACEDTRVTGRLLFHYQIRKPLISFHQHSKIQRLEEIIEKIKNGQKIALVSDSGTPGVSDPGSLLVQKAISAKIKVVPIPGPTALTAALSASGVPSKGVLFLGFLPKKKGRQTATNELCQYWQKGLIIVLYESPHRIIKTLSEIKLALQRAEITCFREISKKFEEIIHLKPTLNENQIKKIKTKGEFTIVIHPKEK